jgi:hypothetical protein
LGTWCHESAYKKSRLAWILPCQEDASMTKIRSRDPVVRIAGIVAGVLTVTVMIISLRLLPGFLQEKTPPAAGRSSGHCVESVQSFSEQHGPDRGIRRNLLHWPDHRKDQSCLRFPAVISKSIKPR